MLSQICQDKHAILLEKKYSNTLTKQFF